MQASPAQIPRENGNGERDISRVLRRRDGTFSSQSPPANQPPICAIMVYQAESAAQRGQIPSLAARRRLAKMAELSIQTAGGGGDAEYRLQPARVEETNKDNKDGYSSPNCTTPPPLIFD